MSTSNDPLARPQTPDRVYYATGRMLGAQDFSAQETYHRGRLARALAYLHGSGTVAGLQVAWAPDPQPGAATAAFPNGKNETLTVQPGIALDRLGRIIEVPRAACIRLHRWYVAQPPADLRLRGAPDNGVVVDVFIHFVACDNGKTPVFAAGPFDGTDAVGPSRVRDAYELELVSRKEIQPPLPQDAWPDLAGQADLVQRRAALHQAILGAWREGPPGWDGDRLKAAPEQVLGQDPTSVFLARLVLPATAAPAADKPPMRTPGAAVRVDNDKRLFVYPLGALARWVGV
jgi:hypothetical protein